MDYDNFYESLRYHVEKKGHGGQALVSFRVNPSQTVTCFTMRLFTCLRGVRGEVNSTNQIQLEPIDCLRCSNAQYRIDTIAE